jgi:hypothetical protein
MAKKNPSKLAQISDENNAADAAQSAQASQLAVSLFVPAGDIATIAGVDESKLERRNLPAMIKPTDVPIGAGFAAEIVKVCDSMVSTVKGKLLWLRTKTGQEFLFPATGVIRNALVPSADEKSLKSELEKEIGKTLVVKRLPDKQSPKYKKTMFMFDVFTVRQ